VPRGDLTGAWPPRASRVLARSEHGHVTCAGAARRAPGPVKRLLGQGEARGARAGARALRASFVSWARSGAGGPVRSKSNFSIYFLFLLHSNANFEQFQSVSNFGPKIKVALKFILYNFVKRS